MYRNRINKIVIARFFVSFFHLLNVKNLKFKMLLVLNFNLTLIWRW